MVPQSPATLSFLLNRNTINETLDSGGPTKKTGFGEGRGQGSDTKLAGEVRSWLHFPGVDFRLAVKEEMECLMGLWYVGSVKK